MGQLVSGYLDFAERQAERGLAFAACMMKSYQKASNTLINDDEKSKEITIRVFENVINMIKEEDCSFEDIIGRITTKGGTTEAGMKNLNQELITENIGLCMKKSYGVEDYSEEFSSEPLAFYYMAGVEVDKDEILPEGMYRKVVPKAKYAVFTVNGNNSNGEIGKAFQYIYFVWLPNSEYCIDENALFDFEYYDERWDCQFGAAQMDIYVPVRRMED